MIRFYTNRELAQKFQINLARWKRWSREFLPPDPLGGMQSGYARQYNANEAFILFLGGHLVGEMKFSIPEARRVLDTVQPWLRQRGFLIDFSGTAAKDEQTTDLFSSWQLVIVTHPQNTEAPVSPSCLARGMETAVDSSGSGGRRRCWVQFSIGPGQDEPDPEQVASYRVLNISVLHRQFLAALRA